jgi:glycosyltransferase involved in cell wall biosynthesis
MKLSFVIPAYNEEKGIGACLEAILAEIKRAGVDAEVLVINNASTDGTREAALKYAGVKVVDEPQKGIVHARARGLEEAAGELVANIDADNRLTSGWITTTLQEFSRDPNLVCLSGPFIYYDLPFSARVITRLFYGLGVLFAGVSKLITGKGAVVQGGNFVFRKQAMIRAGRYNTEIQFYGEDTEVGRRLEPLGRVKFTFALPILSSGRRLAKEGVWLTGLKYALNFLWITYAHKPLHGAGTDIRTNK